MSICQHCSGTGYHTRWCPDRGTFGKATTGRVEITGNIVVHHEDRTEVQDA